MSYIAMGCAGGAMHKGPGSRALAGSQKGIFIFYQRGF